MALRGDYLVVKTQHHSSGTANEVIAESTSVSVDFSAEALETTSQTSGLNASFIGGKVSGTVSGDFLLASGGGQFTELFAHMDNGDTLEIDVYKDGGTTKWFSGEGVLTSLSLSGGNSDQLVTGSYSMNWSGAVNF